MLRLLLQFSDEMGAQPLPGIDQLLGARVEIERTFTQILVNPWNRLGLVLTHRPIGKALTSPDQIRFEPFQHFSGLLALFGRELGDSEYRSLM